MSSDHVLFIVTLPTQGRRIIDAPNEAEASRIALERYEEFPDQVDVAPFHKGVL